MMVNYNGAYSCRCFTLYVTKIISPIFLCILCHVQAKALSQISASADSEQKSGIFFLFSSYAKEKQNFNFEMHLLGATS